MSTTPIPAPPPVDPIAATPGSRTLGTGSHQAMAGNDSRVVGLVSRLISTTSGELTGGGDLSADRTFGLASTAVTPGSYGSASAVGTFTVDAKGRLTAAASTSIAIAESQVTGLVSDLAAKVPTSRLISTTSGDLIGGGDLSANRTLGLANTAVSAASYGDASHVATFTVDAKGRLTAAAAVSIAIADSAVTYTAQAANKIWAGPTSGGSLAPTFRSLVAADLPNTAVSASSYGDATHVASFTVDAQGRLTAASSIAITAGGVILYANVAALIAAAAPSNGAYAATSGYTTANDGGDAIFIYNSASVKPDNGGSIIKPTAVGGGAGRWLIVGGEREVNVKQFGAVGDNVTDDRAAFQAALDSADYNLTFYNPIVTVPLVYNQYYIGGTLRIRRPVIFRGCNISNANGSTLRYPRGCDGIIVDSVGSAYDGPNALAPAAPFYTSCSIENLNIHSQQATEWAPDTHYNIGDYVRARVTLGVYNHPGYYFRCTVAGTSSGTGAEPYWPTVNVPVWQAGHTYNLGDLVKPTDLTKPWVFYCATTTGVSGGSEPVWVEASWGVLQPTGGGHDGGVDWFNNPNKAAPVWPSFTGATFTEGPDTLQWIPEQHHGIRIYQGGFVKGCEIDYFAGDGIYIYSPSGAFGGHPGLANTDLFKFEDITVQQCARNGYHVEGGVTNAGVVLHCSAIFCGQDGFHEFSDLGNSYVGCHTDANGRFAPPDIGRPFYTFNTNGSSTFTGCYCETGQRGIVGGVFLSVLGEPTTDNITPPTIYGDAVSPSLTVLNKILPYTGSVQINLGNTLFAPMRWIDGQPGGGGEIYRLASLLTAPYYGHFSFDSNLLGKTIFSIPGSLSLERDGRFVTPCGIQIADQLSEGGGYLFPNVAQLTDGSLKQIGDRYINCQTVTSGSYGGKTCVRAGRAVAEWQSGVHYNLGNLVKPVNDAHPWYMICTQAGTTGGSEPSWAAGQTVITDGGAKWVTGAGNVLNTPGDPAVGLIAWVYNHFSYAVGDQVFDWNSGGIFECITAGHSNTANVAPTWIGTYFGAVTHEAGDGTAVWRYQNHGYYSALFVNSDYIGTIASGAVFVDSPLSGDGSSGSHIILGTVPIAKGGTNSATALSGSSIMISDGTHIVQGAAGTATTLLHGNASGAPTYGAVSLTADVTGLLPAGNLANTAVTAAAYGSASAVGTFTVDAQGRLTAAATVSIAIADSAITYASQTQNKVHASPNGSSGAPTYRALVAADLPNTAVSAASYGSASAVATFTVDAQGRLTLAATTSIAIAESAVTNLTTDLAGKIGGAPSATGDLLYSTSGTIAMTALADVAVGSYLRSGGVGAAPLWSTLKLPNAATTGDLMVATSTNTIGSVADVAVNQVLRSGGVGAAPAYGQVVAADIDSTAVLTQRGFKCTSSTPTYSLTDSIGGSPTVTITGNNEAHLISFTTGVSLNSNADHPILKVIMANSVAATNGWAVSYTPADATTASLEDQYLVNNSFYITSDTTSYTFRTQLSTGWSVNTTYTWLMIARQY